MRIKLLRGTRPSAGGGGGNGFTPQSGFGVSGTISHGSVITVTRSSGSWGTHADFNSGPGQGYTWKGTPYLSVLMKDFEDGTYEGNGLGYNAGGAVWDVVTSATTALPANLTRVARWRYVTTRQGELQYGWDFNPVHVYSSFKFKRTNFDGKIFRYWGSVDSEYLSTGGADGIGLRGGNDAADDVFGSPDDFTNGWNHVEAYNKTTATVTFKTWLNAQAQWTKTTWPTNPPNNYNGHTMDFGNLIESGGTGYYADLFCDANPIIFFWTDNATFNSSTMREPQVPSAWATQSVDLIVNQGEHASLTSKHLHSYDFSSSTATYIGVTS